jgi:hypothetical protein
VGVVGSVDLGLGLVDDVDVDVAVVVANSS